MDVQKLKKILAALASEDRILWLLFFVALIVRVVYYSILSHHDILTIPILDAEYYLKWANDIIANQPPAHGIFFTEPLYAYLLSFLKSISPLKENLLIIFQMLLGSFLPIIVFKIGREILGRPPAILAGLITATYGPFVFYENLLLKSSLEVFLMMLLVLFFLKSQKSEKLILFFLAGLLLGITTLVKGNGLLFFPLMIYFIWRKKEASSALKLKMGFMLFCGLSLMVFPVTLKNYFSGKDFVLVNYSLGMNFYQGNRFGTDGSLLQPPFVRSHPEFEETDSYHMAAAWMEEAEPKPSAVSSFWISQAMMDIRNHSGSWIQLIGKKIMLLITRMEMSDNYDFGFYQRQIPFLKLLPDFWPIICGGLIGLIFLIFAKNNPFLDKNKATYFQSRKLMLISLFATYGLSIILFHVNSRYRLPLVPFLILFASFLPFYIHEKYREKEYLPFASLIILVPLFLVLTSVNLKNFAFINDANFYVNVANHYWDEKNYQLAEKYFLLANRSDKNNLWSWRSLFYLDMRNGKIEAAKRKLQEELKLRPDDMGVYRDLEFFEMNKDASQEEIERALALREEKKDVPDENSYDPYFYQATQLDQENKDREAEQFLRKSAVIFDNPVNTLVNLAIIRKNSKDIPEAKKLLLATIEKDPYFLPAKYNLAQAYLAEQKFENAAELFQQIFDICPEFSDTWYYLGLSYQQAKKEMAARPIIEGFIKKYQDDPSRQKQIYNLKNGPMPALQTK